LLITSHTRLSSAQLKKRQQAVLCGNVHAHDALGDSSRFIATSRALFATPTANLKHVVVASPKGA